jgi:hypothetical protein
MFFIMFSLIIAGWEVSVDLSSSDHSLVMLRILRKSFGDPYISLAVFSVPNNSF